jgi:peptide/nickel transport system substrate-binding protein
MMALTSADPRGTDPKSMRVAASSRPLFAGMAHQAEEHIMTPLIIPKEATMTIGNGTTGKSAHPRQGTRIGRRALLAGTAAIASKVWLDQGSSTFAQAPGGAATLVVGQASDIANFDPFYTVLHNNFMFRGLYDSIVLIDANGRVAPQLAESWSFSKDARNMTLQLRRGVRFHSGREMDSSDVVYSVKFVQDPKHFSQLQDLFAPIVDMQTPGKYTVVLNFNKPYPGVMDPLNGLYVLDRNSATDLKAKPAGSGPFVVERWEPGHQVVLVRNKNYWDPEHIHLDRIVVRIIPDPTSLGSALQAGDVDLIFNFPLAQYVGLQRDPRLRVNIGSTGATAYDVALNVKRPVFSNKLVRQAMNYALDRKQFVKAVLYGLVAPRSLPCPSYSIGYDKDLDSRYGYDLEKARGLIKRAGMDGASFTAIASNQATPGTAELGEVLQASLKQIGISMTVQNLESARYLELDHASNFDMMLHEYGGVTLTDPDTILNGTIVWRPERNVTNFASPEYTNLVRQAGATVDIAQRRALYRKINELILDECWDIPVASAPAPWAFRQKIRVFSYDVGNYPIYQGARVSG